MPASRILQDSPRGAGSPKAPVGRRPSARSGLRIQSYGTPPRTSPSFPVAHSTSFKPGTRDDLGLISPFARRLRIASNTPSRVSNDPFLAASGVTEPKKTYVLTPPPSSPVIIAAMSGDGKVKDAAFSPLGAQVHSEW